jgi:hypothetical protein
MDTDGGEEMRVGRRGGGAGCDSVRVRGRAGDGGRLMLTGRMPVSASKMLALPGGITYSKGGGVGLQTREMGVGWVLETDRV